jgi:hypothetical protein
LIGLRTGVAVPKAVGLPAACNGAVRWTFRQFGTGAPAGMLFNATTGVLSGTATEVGSLFIDMTLKVDGYAFSVNERAFFSVGP